MARDRQRNDDSAHGSKTRALIALVAAFALTGQAPPASREKPLFATSDPIHIVIQAPLNALARNRSSNVPVAGTLTDPAGQALPVRLRLRGITRRTKDICSFPPLRVDFATPPPATSGFAGQNKLKLVTHCRNGADYQQNLLLEYSAYKMYNLLTPHSFRVRLASIDYRDETGRPIVSRAGYFIEELRDVAARNGMKPTHAPDRIAVPNLKAADAGRFAMFEHMISNHDWSMRAGPEGHDCCHNAELIGPLAAGSTIAIPYDFDFSGFVSAPYAQTPEELSISSVRQRFYRGYCIFNADALAAARQMRASRPQLMAAITSTPGLDPKTAARGIAFLDGFFAQTATDDAVQSNILRRCLGFNP